MLNEEEYCLNTLAQKSFLDMSMVRFNEGINKDANIANNAITTNISIKVSALYFTDLTTLAPNTLLHSFSLWFELK